MAAALESARPVSRACIWCDRPPRPDGRCSGCGKLRDTRPPSPAPKKPAKPSTRPAAALPVAVNPPAALTPPVALAALPVAAVAVPPAVALPDRRPLVEKYRPHTLADVAGQSWIVCQLRGWLEAPHAGAFLFSGATGTGKTSTAVALARELGVNVDDAFFGGLNQIASGEQTGDSVRVAMRQLYHRALSGSGWRVLIVNEADIMTPGAAAVWLDALENLPPRTAVIFTTNSHTKLPQRLRDRCEHFHFESSALLLRPELQTFAARVSRAETGRTDCPPVADFGPLADDNGDASFRRLLQLMESAVRTARAGLPFKSRKQ